VELLDAAGLRGTDAVTAPMTATGAAITPAAMTVLTIARLTFMRVSSST
jgi:hypothetical protein